MLKTGDIIYKVTLEGYDVPCVKEQGNYEKV